MLGIQEMTVLVIYVIKVSGLFLGSYKFLQFCKIQEEAIACVCLRPWSGQSAALVR